MTCARTTNFRSKRRAKTAVRRAGRHDPPDAVDPTARDIGGRIPLIDRDGVVINPRVAVIRDPRNGAIIELRDVRADEES